MSVPGVVGLGGTEDSQTCNSEGSLSKGRPRLSRIDPWHVRVLVVAAVSKHQVCDATGVDSIVIHWE